MYCVLHYQLRGLLSEGPQWGRACGSLFKNSIHFSFTHCDSCGPRWERRIVNVPFDFGHFSSWRDIVQEPSSVFMYSRSKNIVLKSANEIFSLHHRVQSSSGSSQPPIRWVPEAFSLGVKRPSREADHSSQYNAEVNNTWSYTSSPAIHFLGVVLRGNW